MSVGSPGLEVGVLYLGILFDDTRSSLSTYGGKMAVGLLRLQYQETQMDQRLRFLLDNAGPVSRQSWTVQAQPDIWVDESESIILIGEAAHPQSVCT